MIIPTMPLGKAVDESGAMTPEFYQFLTQLIQGLNLAIGPAGYAVTADTSLNIAQLPLQNGTIIYDTTTQQFKGYENGTLKTFTLV